MKTGILLFLAFTSAVLGSTAPQRIARVPDAHQRVPRYSKRSDKECNGYTDLCSKKYSDVAFPTTHNSYAHGDNIAANQNNDIKAQLDAGVRAFMLDIHLQSSVKLSKRDVTLAGASSAATTTPSGSSSSSSDPYLCHTTCLLLNAGPMVNELKNFKTFMDANPNEVITIFIENDDNFSADQISAQFVSAGLDSMAYTPANNTAWPTLESMISSKKRLVVFTDANADSATVPWLLYDKDYAVQTPFEVPVNSQFTCAPNTAVRPLWVMNHFVYANYKLGTTQEKRPDPSSASSVNTESSILEQASLCQKASHFPNFVTVDFYDVGDLFKAVASINGR
ncbi:hypothetical protein FBU59_002609 [Linderina macrospora]|uniref:Uncharacterized protein n=1 Tax=Linderina macrospora TaxID=4868 RepID=A0ACC1JAP2_9FUNG|nr:hypothetical protein FBU59_002609 [Linderina macrospora]